MTSVDSVPTSAGQEDHVSMAPISARKAAQIARNVAGIIAPWLTGAIAHRTGSFASAFVLCAFILVAGALAYWLLMNETVRSPEEA